MPPERGVLTSQVRELQKKIHDGEAVSKGSLLLPALPPPPP
jgi:hypothetical protein